MGTAQGGIINHLRSRSAEVKLWQQLSLTAWRVFREKRKKLRFVVRRIDNQSVTEWQRWGKLREDQGGRHFLEWGCEDDDLKRAYSDITGRSVYMVDYIIIIVNNEGAVLAEFMPMLPPI